jgi:hypothetical protein
LKGTCIQDGKSNKPPHAVAGPFTILGPSMDAASLQVQHAPYPRMEVSKALHERFALTLVTRFKLLDESLLDGFGTGPMFQLVAHLLMLAVESSQDRKRLLEGGREIDGTGWALVWVERRISVNGRTLSHPGSWAYQRASMPLANRHPE